MEPRIRVEEMCVFEIVVQALTAPVFAGMSPHFPLDT